MAIHTDMVRKVRSIILRGGRSLCTNLTIIKLRLLYSGIEIGQNVTFGSKVRIRTSDGGRIKIGDNVKVEDGCFLQAQRGVLNIGNGTFVGAGTHLCTINKVTVGEKCIIAAYCVIRDMQHGTQMGMNMIEQNQESAPVKIGNDVWLGAHAVVTDGVCIQGGAVVGANAVVTKNVDAEAVVAGVPAKLLRKRTK